MQKALGALPVILGPIVILFIRRIVQIWYTRKGDAEERTLQKLLKQQREKVEEIKKKTNYYSTRELLQRYDESSPSATPLRQRSQPPQPPNQPSAPVTPQRQTPSKINVVAARTPVSPALMELSSTASTPPGPPRKQWLDKIVDVVLGDDDSARFALICEKCFSHNGLVKESVWEDTQYVCPKCKHFNPSKRSKKVGSPVSPTFQSQLQPQSPGSRMAGSPSSASRSSQSESLSASQSKKQPKSPLGHTHAQANDDAEKDDSMDIVED